MGKLTLFDKSMEKRAHTVVLETEPYNGEVEIDVVPKTRSLVMDCMEKAKRNPIFNRHSILNDDGKKVSRQGRPDDAFVQELAKALIVDWRGVVDQSGEPVECTDENKILLFENVEVANYLVKAASELGTTKEEEEVDNLKNLSAGTSPHRIG